MYDEKYARIKTTFNYHVQFTVETNSPYGDNETHMALYVDTDSP